MAKKKKTQTAATGAVPGDRVSGLGSAVKAVQWFATKARSDGGTELASVLKPLILVRAAKYQLDAQAAKGSKVEQRPKDFKGRKRTAEEAALALHPTAAAPTAAELEEASKALKALAEQPEELLTPSCKALRTALHPLVEQHLREEKASPAFRITSMLGERSRWPEALRLLRDLRQQPAEKRPRLGAYQRWVRELDVAEGDEAELLMLDAVMRLAAGFGAVSSSTALAAGPGLGRLELLAPWAPKVEQGRQPHNRDVAEKAVEATPGRSMANKLVSLISSRRAGSPAACPGTWRVLAHEKAADRMPPNHYDLDIYTCPPSVLPLNVAPVQPTQRHEMPGVEGGFVLTDVLSPEECLELKEATEKIGYRPDVPISSKLDERAHNVVLMANEVQNKSLFERLKHLLPSQIGDEKLLGLNRRWRFYRYFSGNLYRKHLDGAWPASGISVEGAQERYVYDAHGGGTRSKLTFIIYLNDDFEGGCTTFFTPKAGEEGTLHSRPIRPVVGSASVFPHGDCPKPLLHEGSAVTKGTKYLLRTDVVYARPETPDELKHQARLRGLARQLGGLGGLGGQGLVEQEKEGDEVKGKVGKGKKRVKKSSLKGKSKKPEGDDASKEQKGKKVLKQIKQPQSNGKDRAYGKRAKKRGSAARRR